MRPPGPPEPTPAGRASLWRAARLRWIAPYPQRTRGPDPHQRAQRPELGLLLFMLSSGLTLIFSMMGVLNFAHASFYMLGAYVAYTLRLAGLLGGRCCWRRWWWACWVRCSSACAAARAQVRPRARTADHLRPELCGAGAGATDLGPLGVTSPPAPAAGTGCSPSCDGQRQGCRFAWGERPPACLPGRGVSLLALSRRAPSWPGRAAMLVACGCCSRARASAW
jgi:hypothetical protein